MKPIETWLACEPLAQENKEAWLRDIRNESLDAAVDEIQKMREDGECDLRCAISCIKGLKNQP